MFEVFLTEGAESDFGDASLHLQRKVNRAFDNLRVDARRGNNIKALKGKFAGRFRYRGGRLANYLRDRRRAAPRDGY